VIDAKLKTSNPKGIPSSFPHPPPSAPQEGTKQLKMDEAHLYLVLVCLM